MQVYCVVTEFYGGTRKLKDQGETRTEIKRNEYRYAAEDLEDVWVAAHKQKLPEETIIALYEEHPAIVIIGAQ